MSKRKNKNEPTDRVLDAQFLAPEDYVYATNLDILDTLVETQDSLLALLVVAVRDGDVEQTNLVKSNLQAVSDNITGLQAFLVFGAEDEDDDWEAYEEEPVVPTTTEPIHGVLGYTITCQIEGSTQVEHNGEIIDIDSFATRLFKSVGEARAFTDGLIFSPGATVHIAAVIGVEQVETVFSL